MLKRQESSLSSSHRQAASVSASTTPPPETHHAKGIGCMSGIIHLFSKYQNPNKRLTFGRKQEKSKPSSPAKAKGASIPAAKNSAKEDKIEKQTFDTSKRLTCEVKVLRSPTLPPEIRRSTAASSPENSRTPSSLVARLMGLEDTAPAARRPAFDGDPLVEKRQRLLQALEKCNEDLEALKRIIKAVQTADVRIQPPHPAAPKRGLPGAGNDAKPCIKKCTFVTAEEQNIPASDSVRSPLGNVSIVHNTTIAAGAMRAMPHQRKPTAAKKPGEDDEPIAKLHNHSTITESSLLVRRRAAASQPVQSSRAMVESVEEVCRDIAWGEKREAGRIGLVLQDQLCKELIEEVIKELLKPSCNVQPLPLEACKRRLCF
ncbi:hypothetical protein Sango_0836000 [Sesamum angolense]|uniref:DUF3741 domain-containing protein n=1 Tax=Sesamum angolense TaxID=2727404 RepID=A0AAE2C0L5_9LAMI|nr:hypothetical protein Sango_0836000 [Sesamum angolense]